MGKKVKDKRRAKRKAARREEKIMEAEQVLFRCPSCGVEENIPEDVVMQFDLLDDGDTSVPPKFKCEHCPADMEPVFYESVHGVIHKINE
jgi:uncharacterized OB-fold protein